ncbi:tyrosine-type recombinase/integrase [Candidatus Woesearchaeota archaeon]|nr:tyrosine-type recombinase/integrase [Candidatus Woesearchaeota archaeon]
MLNSTDYEERLKQELLSRGFSHATFKTYSTGMNEFAGFLKKELRYAKNDDFRDFKLFLREKKFATKTINSYLAAVKFFYRNVMSRKLAYLPGYKNAKKLPVVHNQEFILEMIEKTENLKHKLLISLLYSSGLRVSEAIRLRLENIDIPAKECRIIAGKGNKDRISILSDNFIGFLSQYLTEYDIASGYLFPSHKGHVCTRTAEEIVKQAAARIDKNRRVFCHSLRSSFATHLMENNVPINKISDLLGHTDLRTTQVYLNVNRKRFEGIRSPIDVVH